MDTIRTRYVREAAGDWSGRSVKLSSDGSIVAIDSRNNDGNGSNSGSVRVYQYNGSIWTQLGQDIDGEAAGDYSGDQLAYRQMAQSLL